ncbi:MerR family transcriptional regulator [Salinisphaera japonica]|uniref:Transcriptional regulator n=1 Tax=Salinisphaera japonica YTM-1 TaxID=1209778 RepID=A0A423Q2A5_9GAMM|nr:transcriptional regulator [Salinisphaera japonica YTM-1]
MSSATETDALPAVPDKRYFPIGEASALCGVKPHVLRYWEQEFAALSPVKRRGNRRYYRTHDIHTARRIRHLLYDMGFTIAGARAQLTEGATPTAIVASTSPLADIRTELESILQKLEE